MVYFSWRSDLFLSRRYLPPSKAQTQAPLGDDSAYLTIIRAAKGASNPGKGPQPTGIFPDFAGVSTTGCRAPDY